jgi:hypothetical protein
MLEKGKQNAADTPLPAKYNGCTDNMIQPAYYREDLLRGHYIRTVEDHQHSRSAKPEIFRYPALSAVRLVD